MVRHVHILFFGCFLSAFFAASAFGQTSPVGFWKTIDDATGEAKSVVKIYEANGKLKGDVVEILQADEDAPHNDAGQIICTNCDGDREDQPIEGMNILWGLEKDGSEWTGGRIMDPENGKTYKAKIWLEDGGLMVRGYLGFSLLGRSQRWEWIGATR